MPAIASTISHITIFASIGETLALIYTFPAHLYHNIILRRPNDTKSGSKTALTSDFPLKWLCAIIIRHKKSKNDYVH